MTTTRVDLTGRLAARSNVGLAALEARETSTTGQRLAPSCDSHPRPADRPEQVADVLR